MSHGSGAAGTGHEIENFFLRIFKTLFWELFLLLSWDQNLPHWEVWCWSQNEPLVTITIAADTALVLFPPTFVGNLQVKNNCLICSPIKIYVNIKLQRVFAGFGHFSVLYVWSVWCQNWNRIGNFDANMSIWPKIGKFWQFICHSFHVGSGHFNVNITACRDLSFWCQYIAGFGKGLLILMYICISFSNL